MCVMCDKELNLCSTAPIRKAFHALAQALTTNSWFVAVNFQKQTTVMANPSKEHTKNFRTTDGIKWWSLSLLVSWYHQPILIGLNHGRKAFTIGIWHKNCKNKRYKSQNCPVNLDATSGHEIACTRQNRIAYTPHRSQIACDRGFGQLQPRTTNPSPTPKASSPQPHPQTPLSPINSQSHP